ncbi:MAG: ATP-binding domain-containing protein [Actinobacteria bacterium]|nr:ATP-binding domain-containing protein [Actinomycetota bacterium]
MLGDALHDSVTVWYEPLFDVGGDRPDLIALIPDTGVLVIEILQHKASAIVDVADGHLTVTEDGGKKLLSHPLRRARRFAEDLAFRVRAAGIEPGDELPVAAMGVFAYIDTDTAQAKGILTLVDAHSCLFRGDLERINRDLTRARQTVAAAMAAPLREVISEDAERLYRAVIHPDTVLTPVQMALPDMDVTMGLDVKALDRQQENLAKTLGGGHRVIRGVAGSGKTVILVHRARLLAQLDRRSRILVTCYNNSLRGWLERQLMPYPNVKVRTLSSQMGEVLRMGGAPPASYNSEDGEAVAARALDVLADLGDRARSQLFDYVLVDEAQDFGAESLRFATKLLRDGSDSLLVVADAAQSIYRKGFTWKEAGIEASGRTKVLTRNYRNSREILDYAWSFLSRSALMTTDGAEGDCDVVVPPEAGLRHGPLPLFRHHASPDEEVLDIAQEVDRWLNAGESPGDIAVLYGSRSAGGFPWVEKLQRSFERLRVPWYWPTNPDDPSKDLAGARDDAVMICTMHSAKGLEFKNVILCAYLDDRPPEEPDTSRRLVYVGMTRARERLVLTASGNHPYIADLEAGPAGT